MDITHCHVTPLNSSYPKGDNCPLQSYNCLELDNLGAVLVWLNHLVLHKEFRRVDSFLVPPISPLHIHWLYYTFSGQLNLAFNHLNSRLLKSKICCILCYAVTSHNQRVWSMSANLSATLFSLLWKEIYGHQWYQYMRSQV